jgi:cell division protein FtsL
MSKVVIVLSTVAVVFAVGTISSCVQVRQLKNSRDKEILTRMEIEERLSKLMQGKSTADDQLRSLKEELAKERSTRQATEKALLQEQLVNESLKEELSKVTRLKETLEADLKAALEANQKMK